MNYRNATRRSLLKLSALSIGGFGPRRLLGDDHVSVGTIHDEIQRRAGVAPLSMQFRGSTPEDCRRWQRQFRGKLRELLGPHAPPGTWTTHVERTVTLDDHERRELVLTAAGHPALPVHLLLPKGDPDARRPGVLAIHGHGTYGYDAVVDKGETPEAAAEFDRFNYRYGVELVRRGYVVAAPCLTPFGRRLGDREHYGRRDPCGVTNVRLNLLGKLLIAENLRDCLWALALLGKHETVDPERLGCVGLSYGGRMTMLTAAVEPRIRAAVISGALNVWQERVTIHYSCGAQVIPGLLLYGDIPEIGSLIAPRPCVWEVGSEDDLIDPAWADKALVRLRRAYHAYDADAALQIDRFKGGHRWHGDHAYDVLAKALNPRSPAGRR
jgi:dienelactone hydrolase